MTTTCYVIDASSLIELKRMNPMDIYPGVWKRLSELVNAGLLCAPMEVKRELKEGDDDLFQWAVQNNRMFTPCSDQLERKVAEIMERFPSMIDSDKEDPAADPFVVALALVKDPQQKLMPSGDARVVVSEEKLKGNKIKIPFVCLRYGIECITIHEMFRREGWTF